MDGVFDVTIKGPKVNYKLHLNSKVTVLRGNSGTGKSHAIQILLLSANNPSIYKVSVSGGAKLVTFNSDQLLYLNPGALTNSVIILDESDIDTLGDLLSTYIKQSDAYWILISRSDELIKSIPYSLSEIYVLEKTNGCIRNVPIFEIPKNRLLKSAEHTVSSVELQVDKHYL